MPSAAHAAPGAVLRRLLGEVAQAGYGSDVGELRRQHQPELEKTVTAAQQHSREARGR